VISSVQVHCIPRSPFHPCPLSRYISVCVCLVDVVFVVYYLMSIATQQFIA